MAKNNYLYIKRNTKDIYLEFEEKINPEEYNVGTTYEDYLDNKIVLLSKEQVKFHEDNPQASVKEVWDMELIVSKIPERTIGQAKTEALHKLNIYDNSFNVNGFTINNTIKTWFTPTERSNYSTSVNSAKILGIDKLSFFVGNIALEVPTNKAEYMLAAIQLYADSCYIVTKQHQLAIEALETIEEVDSYDYTTGYPDKLNFDLV